MNYVKFAFFTVIVMIIEFGISYLVAYKFNLRFINAISFVGLFFTFISIFLSSTGGALTNLNDIKAATSLSGQMSNYKLKRTSESLSINCFNLGSILFFLIGIVVTLVLYWH
jgi:hypothetical protein